MQDFIDIHSHIIPGVDDGSADMETSLKLVDLAYGEGIRRIVCTPHFGIINPTYDPGIVKEQFEALTAEVEALHPEMKLYLGNEIYLAPGYPDGLEDGMANTLAGSSYVLVEFPFQANLDLIVHECRRLLLRGYLPVMAHAERYQGAWRNLKGLETIRGQGVKIQVNASALAREYGQLYGGRTPGKGQGCDNGSSGLLSRIARSGGGAESADTCDDSDGKTKALKAGSRARKQSQGSRGLGLGGLSSLGIGRRRKGLVCDMLESGLVDFIATDTHDMPGRLPVMREAADIVVELVGEAAARRILVENPEMVLGDA